MNQTEWKTCEQVNDVLILADDVYGRFAPKTRLAICDMCESILHLVPEKEVTLENNIDIIRYHVKEGVPGRNNDTALLLEVWNCIAPIVTGAHVWRSMMLKGYSAEIADAHAKASRAALPQNCCDIVRKYYRAVPKKGMINES